MDIVEVKKRFDLYKMATKQNVVAITDLAKELKVRVTDLMEFINDNPKLFITEECWSYKNKTEYSYVFGHKCKNTIRVKDKCKGLGLTNVYLTAEENYTTNEWLIKKIEDNEKTIWVSAWDNYGTIEGYYVRGDYEDKNDKYNSFLWRNTASKINELKELGILYDTTFYIGGFGDCTEHKSSTAINKEGMKKAEELGWTIIR